MIKKNILILAGVVGVMLIIGAVIFFALPNSSVPQVVNNNSFAGANVPTGFSPTHTAAPAGAVAPSEGSATTSASVAIPLVQVPAAPGSDASFRSFGIQVISGNYSPSTIIVNQGDTVHLSITAVDGNYGFTQPDYGLHASILKGKTQTIQFGALQTGKFTFFCDSCGGPAKGPVGTLIVVTSHS